MKKTTTTPLFLTLAISLGCSLITACSDVNLSYGVGVGGLTSISDRNRNAALPGAFEDLQGLNIVPTPTPHLGSGDGISGEGANNPAPGAPASPLAEPVVTPSAAPTTSVPIVQGSEDSGEGRFKLRLIPNGPIELNNFGDRKLVQLFLNDLAGNTVDPSAYTFVWTFEDPKLAEIDSSGKYVISKTEKGVTRVKISVKEDPDTFIIVDILIGQSAPSSGGVGGGGGGGGGGSSSTPTPTPTATAVPTPTPTPTATAVPTPTPTPDPTPTPTATPEPTPTPKDRVTGVVLFS